MPKVDFTEILAAWCQRKVQEAHSADLEITFDRTRDGRTKHSAWVELEFQGRLGELMIWSTGEAEYMVGDESGPAVNEHHEVGSIEQLHVLLERLIEAVQPSQ
ncbi:hypothetical protein HUT18_06315 [Streptomyces sp. NA04227]|uniref:hypothetical protein n=1 Tax=Streptomyces sp. NA04227 TaxID=2742136 RepID=UPI0015907B7D|nr:hypothetical protein [Streptomyces sp. NA04227]QKW06071.1 hypothetical protein HUT18_06315 [Streptomyces sp. NA04227]